MSKKLGFNISDLLGKPNGSSTGDLMSPIRLSIPSASSSTEYQQDRSTQPTTIESSPSVLTTATTILNNNNLTNDPNGQLSNYEQLMRASSMYRNQEYSLLPIVNGTYPWIQTDSVLKDRFSLFNSQRRLGHPYQNRTPPKRKKPRTSFTRLQILELEKRFHRQKYLASSERSQLAKGLKMTDAQVKTWFQNRRTKWRRQTAEEREQERQAASRLVLSGSHHRRRSSSSSCTSPSSSPKLTSPSNNTTTDHNNSLIYSSASLNALQNLQPWSAASNISTSSSTSTTSDDSNQRDNNRH